MEASPSFSTLTEKGRTAGTLQHGRDRLFLFIYPPGEDITRGGDSKFVEFGGRILAQVDNIAAGTGLDLSDDLPFVSSAGGKAVGVAM